MMKLNVKELMEDLNLGEYEEEIVEYDDGIIQEVIYEIAGGIFTSDHDLWDWARVNQDVVNANIATFDIDIDNLNLTSIFQSAYTYNIENELLSNVKHIVKYWIYHNFPHYEISQDIVDYIEDYSNAIDTNKRLEWIMEEIKDYMEVYHNDEL